MAAIAAAAKRSRYIGKSPILPLRDFVGGIGANTPARRAAEPMAPPRGVLTPRSLVPQDGGHLHRGLAAAGGRDLNGPRPTTSRSIAHCPTADFEKMLSPRRANHSDS